MNTSSPSEDLRADTGTGIALPHLCHYLEQLPPPHQQPLLYLYEWTLRYAPSTTQNGHPQKATPLPFKGLPTVPDASHEVLKAFQRLPDQNHCQGVLTHPLHLEAWARYHCLLANVPIQGESIALSKARWHYVSPLQWQAAQRKQTAYEQRAQALALMQQRKGQTP